MIVGAYADDDNVAATLGSAYIFVRNATSWTQQAKVTASDGEAGDNFGLSVSLDGETAVVGASREDSNGGNAGAAYVFRRTGAMWTEESKLLASDGVQGDLFSDSVSISADRPIAGAIYREDFGSRTGAAYLFESLAASTGGLISTGSGSVSIIAAAADLQGTIAGTGALVIKPSQAASTIGLGGGVGDLNLIDAELQALADGFSSITIGDIAGGTGTVDIETVTLTDPVTIAGGTINDNANTDITAPSVTLDGNVSPGQSPGILTVIGNFAFADNDTFTVEIGGTTPGTANTNHDQIDVTGSVTIGTNVTLTTTAFNGFTPVGSDSFVIIENDAADAVSGTFAGLSRRRHHHQFSWLRSLGHDHLCRRRAATMS